MGSKPWLMANSKWSGVIMTSVYVLQAFSQNESSGHVWSCLFYSRNSLSRRSWTSTYVVNKRVVCRSSARSHFVLWAFCVANLIVFNALFCFPLTMFSSCWKTIGMIFLSPNLIRIFLHELANITDSGSDSLPEEFWAFIPINCLLVDGTRVSI